MALTKGRLTLAALEQDPASGWRLCRGWGSALPGNCWQEQTARQPGPYPAQLDPRLAHHRHVCVLWPRFAGEGSLWSKLGSWGGKGKGPQRGEEDGETIHVFTVASGHM